MASSNAGPITGRERIRILQGGFDVWVDRPQFTSILALASQANVGPRPYTSPTTILGTETFSAWQDGAKITLNAADIATFLAGSGNAPAHPDPNLLTTPSGNELIMGHQSGFRVAWSIAETLAIQATAGPVLYPVNTVAPTISGTPQVGSVLTSSQGTWTNSPTAYAYQWKAAGSNVGTNANTYTPVTGDIGKTITVTVTATNANPGSGQATSAPTSAVIAAGTPAVLAASRRIVAIGSSSEARRGVGVDGDSVWMNGARGASYYDIAIKRLAQRGFNINNQAWQGNSNNGPSIVDFIGIDTRFHDQTGAITMSSTRCAGGVPLLFGPTAAEFTVDLDQSVNMIAFYAGCTNVGRAFFVAIDGVEQPSFTLGTSDARYLIDLTQNGLTPGAKRVTFRVKVGTGSVRLQGMEAWTSTTKEIRYISSGSRGWSTSDWSNSTTLASLALLSSAEPFTLFDTMGGNESLTNSADVTAYIARRKSVWDSVKTANAGNTILVGIKPFIGNFDGSSPFQSGSSVTELDVSNAVKAAATTDGYAWFDLTPAAGSFATAQSNGEVRPGTVPHYTRPWHSRVGGGPLGLGDWLISTGLTAAGVSFTGGYAAPAYQPLALGVYMLDAIQGSAYTFTPYKGGGTTGTWSLSAVSPLTINASTGVVTGTPSTVYGETKTTLTFTDADGTVATVGRYIRSIDPATIIWPLDTFDGTAGAALSNAYATNNGGHYTISAGSASFDTPTGTMWSNALEAGSADQLLYSSDFRLTMKVKAVTVVGGLSAGVAVRGQVATNLNTFEVVIFSATSGLILQHRDGGTVTSLATVAAATFGGWVAGRTYTAIADFRGASATISLSDDAGGSWPNILTFTGEELELYRSQRYWGLRSSGASSATTGWHYDQVKFETLP